MAQITLNIPNGVLSRVLDGIAGKFGYKDKLLDENNNVIDNPETKAQFAKRQTIEWVKDCVRTYEHDAATSNINIDLSNLNIT